MAVSECLTSCSGSPTIVSPTSCGHTTAACCEASLTSSHGSAGCGLRNLLGPVGGRAKGIPGVLVPGPDIYYLLLSVFTLECLEHIARVRGVHRPAHRPQAGAVHRGGAVGGRGRHSEDGSTYLATQLRLSYPSLNTTKTVDILKCNVILASINCQAKQKKQILYRNMSAHVQVER